MKNQMKSMNWIQKMSKLWKNFSNKNKQINIINKTFLKDKMKKVSNNKKLKWFRSKKKR